MAREVIAAADTTVIVTDLSLSALRHTHRLVELAKSLESRSKPLIVANQVGSRHRGEIGRPESERGPGDAPDLVTPFAAKPALAAAHTGKALAAAAATYNATP